MQVVIDSYGVKVSVAEGLLLISGEQRETARIPIREIDGLQVGRGVMLTSDALMLCIEHDIRVLLMDWGGQPLGHLWHGRFGSISTIRRKQLLFAEHQVGMHWVRQGISQKIEAQIAFAKQLAYMQFDEAMQNQLLRTIAQAERTLLQLKAVRIFDPNIDLGNLRASFRGWEGAASRAYFQCLSASLPEGYRFETRGRRPAQDRFNCVLNYLYGILYGLVEIALIKAGIDPYIAVMHADQYNAPSMVFDAIEPYRHWADVVAFRLCQGHELPSEGFEHRNGGLWLGQQAKPRAIEAFFQYLDEVIPNQNDVVRKRKNQLSLDAQQLAQTILAI